MSNRQVTVKAVIPLLDSNRTRICELSGDRVKGNLQDCQPAVTWLRPAEVPTAAPMYSVHSVDVQARSYGNTVLPHIIPKSHDAL